MTPITIRRLPRVGTRGVKSGAFAYFSDPQGSLFGAMNGHALRVAGIGMTLDTDGVIAELRNTASMRRTADIRQFDLKRFPLPAALGTGCAGKPFNHTRFDHMIGAGAISQLVIHNNRDAIPASDHETLVAYDTTHDVSSVAFNDGAKLLGSFEEDEHYCASFLGDTGVQSILERHGARTELMALLAREAHPQYKLLHDIVDRISYVAGDVEEFERLAGPTPETHRLSPNDPIRRIAELSRAVDGRPIGSIWETVRYDTEGPYFMDGEQLARFLELRANLFAGIYLNPQSRGADHPIALCLLRYLFARGMIGFGDLIKMNDTALREYLEQVTGFNRQRAERNGLMPLPKRIFPQTLEEAQRASAAHAATGNITLVEDCSRGSGTAVGWRIKKGKRIKPLRELLPEAAERIEQVMKQTRRIMLNLVNADSLREHGVHEDFTQKLIAFERERLGM